MAVISTAGAGPTAPMMGARLWEGEPGLLDPDEGPPGGPCSDSHAAKPRMPLSQQARSAARITSALGCSVSKQHSHLHTQQHEGGGTVQHSVTRLLDARQNALKDLYHEAALLRHGPLQPSLRHKGPHVRLLPSATE